MGRRLTGLLLASLLLPAVAAAAEPVRLVATFVHGKAAPAYLASLDGIVMLDLDASAKVPRLAFRLGLGEQSCRLAMLWGPDPKAAGQAPLTPTGPVEVCLARGDLDDRALDAWAHGTPRIDPALVVVLAADGHAPGRLVNPAEVRGRLFVRDCGPPRRYRTYGDLVIPPGALEVVATPSQAKAPALTLRATRAAVTGIDATTWTEVVRACGNAHVALPSAPVDGVSAALGGSSAGVRPVGDPAHQAIDAVRLGVEAVVEDGELKAPLGRRLVAGLDRADGQRRAGDGEAAAQTLAGVGHEVATWAGAGLLPPDEAGALLGDVEAAGDFVRATVAGDARVVLPCGVGEICPAATWYVDARTSVPDGERDGSVERPFQTIAEALAVAAARGLCAVELRISPAVYGESLTVTRHTTLRGWGRAKTLVRPVVRPVVTGPVRNEGPHRLTIESVDFADTPDSALTVRSDCATTELRRVTIARATHRGIDQEGGTLSADGLTVSDTRLAPGQVASGLAVRLAGGVRAVLQSATLRDNAGQALLVTGEGTKALARSVTVTGNRWPIGVVAQLGAVTVDDRGLLLMESSAIDENQVIGLHVTNESRAHFRAGWIARTRSVDIPGFGHYLGINVGVHFSGVLELASFTASYAEWTGLQYAIGGVGTATDGEVSHQPIGANVQTEPFELRCLQVRTGYRDNGANLDAASLPIPEDGHTPEAPPVCPVVPFVCDWCAGGG